MDLCVVTFFGLLTCLFFTIFVKWIYGRSNINLIQYDIATTTAGDYTVEMDIKKENYLEWYNNEY